MNKTTTGDDIRKILLIIIFPGISAAVLLVAPSLVGEMISGLGFSSANAGFIISVELGGMSLATLPAYYWINKVNIQRAASVAAIVSIIGNLLTATQTEFLPILVLRLVTALSHGSLMVICFNTMGKMQNKDRAFGFHVIGQLILGAVGVAVLPQLFAVTGLYIAYVILALLMAVSMPLIRFFPESLASPLHTLNSGNRQKDLILGSLGILGVFLFYISLSGVWTYAERVGVVAGIESVPIGYALSFATVLGILGAVIATITGGLVNQLLPVVIGMFMMSISVYLFLDIQTFIAFIIATGMFKFAWTFVLPFLLGCVAKIDETGRLVMTTYLLLTTALSVGPAIAAVIIGESADYGKAIQFSFWVIVISTSIMIFVAQMIDRKSVVAFAK